MKEQKFGELIHSLRLEKKLALRGLSEKAGISHSYISQLESGERAPSPEIIKKLAFALEYDFYTLFRVAGYLDTNVGSTIFESEYLTNTEMNTVYFEVPGAFKNYSEDGTENFAYISPEESKRWFLDLNYLLKYNEELYFKQKLLNEKEKERILKFLGLLLENN